jgi:hypothetical protein
MSDLAPVPFHPDIAAAAMIPVAIDPASVRVRWLHIRTGNPDVGVTVPTVISSVPGPVSVFGRRGRDSLYRTWRRSNTDNHLGLGNAGGKKERAGNNREEFLHRAISLWC